MIFEKGAKKIKSERVFRKININEIIMKSTSRCGSREGRRGLNLLVAS